MCTLVILRRPGNEWPLLLASNRDEMSKRAWSPPARHWPQHQDIIGGIDHLGGGTWLALSEQGVVAALLNRRGTLGPEEGKLSRGELPLQALTYNNSREAAQKLTAKLNPANYRPFNLLIADHEEAYLLIGKDGAINCSPVPENISLLTSRDLNDISDSRIAGSLPRFRQAPTPNPTEDDWQEWVALLADRRPVDPADPRSALSFLLPSGFGTVSSSLIALGRNQKTWRFAAGPPNIAPYQNIKLS